MPYGITGLERVKHWGPTNVRRSAASRWAPDSVWLLWEDKNPLRLSRIEPKILCLWVCNLFNSLPELPGNNLVIIQQGFKDLSFINQIKATVSIMPFPCHWFEGTTSVIVVSRAHTSASGNIPSPPTDNRKAPADSWDKEVRYLKILPIANVYGVVIQ